MTNPQGPDQIEWATHTINVVHGCTPITHPEHPSACERCYAVRMAHRLKGRCGYPADDPFRVTERPDRLPELLRVPAGSRVFVDSMGDLFHEAIPDSFILATLGVMSVGAKLGITYIVLTKRPGRARRVLVPVVNHAGFRSVGWMLHDAMCRWVPLPTTRSTKKRTPASGTIVCGEPSWPLPNVWLVATTESQHWLEQRIHDLLSCPAAVRGISVEGMLGPVDARRGFRPTEQQWRARCFGGAPPIGWRDVPGLDWVICGAEQGPRARPFDSRWALDLRGQCRDAGVPFFFKKLPGRANPAAELLVREWPGEIR